MKILVSSVPQAPLRAIRELGHEGVNGIDADGATVDLTGVDLVMRVYSHPIANAAALFDRCRERGIVTLEYNLDLWAPLPRGDTFVQSLLADYAVTTDGGDPAWWAARGVKHVYLRAGAPADECYLHPGADGFEDVVFVGSKPYHPEWPYRGRLLDWAAATYGSRFGLYGSGGDVQRGAALNRLYASAKVVLGDTFCPGAIPPDAGTPIWRVLPGVYANYWSDRVYETLGRGGVLVHPFVEGMQDEFRDMEHLLFYRYGDFDELKDKIDFLLLHELVRQHLRHAGHERVKSRCTYAHRMAWLLDYLAEREPSIRRVHEPSRTVDPLSGGVR